MKWVPGGTPDPRGGAPASRFGNMAEALCNPNLAASLRGMGVVMVCSVLLTSFLPLYLKEQLEYSVRKSGPGSQDETNFSEPIQAGNRHKRLSLRRNLIQRPVDRSGVDRYIAMGWWFNAWVIPWNDFRMVSGTRIGYGNRVAFAMESSSDTFDALWAQTHTCLCWFIYSRVGSEEDAEDLLQDVFLRVYRQLGTVRDPQRMESWIYQIARNRIIDHYRSRRQWADLPENLVMKEDSAEEPAEDTSISLLPHVCAVIDGLPEPDREALLQTDFQGMTQPELAGQFGISLSGAKSRVQRARQKVKKALLECFEIEFDPRGGILNYQPHCCP